MKRFALSLAALSALTLVGGSAVASDNYNGRSIGGHNGAQLHANLNHRAVDRQIQHHNAHDRGISPWQDYRLHSQLNHQASHDRARHRSADYNRAVQHNRGYGFSNGRGHGSSGFNLYGPNFNVRFGH